MSKGRRLNVEMALYKFLCAAAVAIVLTPNGCLSQLPDCGRGGRYMNPAEGPWRVLIKNANGRMTPTECSGSLITDQWVMTSSHCNRPAESIVVHLGKGSNSLRASVIRIECKGYNESIMKKIGGVCLLKLDVQVKFTEYISPVCLPMYGSMYHSGMSSYTATDKYSSEEVTVPIVGPNKCKCDRLYVEPDMICAGDGVQQGERDDCQKNLGGALLTFDQDVWILIGIVRMDPMCPPPGYLRTYNNVSMLEYWIKSVTDANYQNFKAIYDSEASRDDMDSHYYCETSAPPPSMMPPYPPYPDNGTYPSQHDDMYYPDSIFVSGVNVIHSSPFILFCLLILSLFCAY